MTILCLINPNYAIYCVIEFMKMSYTVHRDVDEATLLIWIYNNNL